jgi:hypothetical protein
MWKVVTVAGRPDNGDIGGCCDDDDDELDDADGVPAFCSTPLTMGIAVLFDRVVVDVEC